MVIILLLLLVIVHLNVCFYKEKKDFELKLAALQEVVVVLTKAQAEKQEEIQLSEELNDSIKGRNGILNQAIFGLNFELFDILSKNNLLKKK